MSELSNRDSAGRERPDDTISMLDLIAVVVRRRWLIIVVTALVSLSTLGILIASIKLPPTSRWNLFPTLYKPTVKILVQDTSPSSSLSSMLNQTGLGALSGFLGGSNLTGLATSANLALALLKSKSIEDGVAQKFAFGQRYGITTNSKSAARGIIEKSLKAVYDDKSGILEIGYEDVDKVFATDVINDIADRLQQEFKHLTLDKVITKKEYLENAIASSEKETAAKSAQLLAFQTKYGIYDLTAQAEANVTAYANLQTQVAQKQMDLELQRKYLPETDNHIVLLKDQIGQLQKQIDQMQGAGSVTTSGAVPLSRMAQLSVQYLSLQRDVQGAQAILTVLKQQYETTKLEEMDTSQIFQVVEKAEVPEMRSAPSRSRTGIMAMLVGFFIAVLLAFVVEYFDRARRDPVEAGKLAMIRASFSRRRRRGNPPGAGG
jgi:uncharacterized protein involved in exopolysaccharide biosynthesis